MPIEHKVNDMRGETEGLARQNNQVMSMYRSCIVNDKIRRCDTEEAAVSSLKPRNLQVKKDENWARKKEVINRLGTELGKNTSRNPPK